MHLKKLFIAAVVLISALAAAPARAVVVPVFDWVVTYTGTVSPLSNVFGGVRNQAGDAIYLGSHFSGTPDLDPTSGTDSIASFGDNDAFLSKFSSDGTYQWTKTWGGTLRDLVGVVDMPDSTTVIVGGYFRDTVDFDPGAGVTYATSTGGLDSFIAKFDSDGNFQWVRTWGKTTDDEVISTFTFDQSGNIYVYSIFTGEVDFDPGATTASSTSSGGFDNYLSKFSSDGTYQWTKTWGGTGNEGSGLHGIKVDGDDLILVGSFNSTVDFDPGAGTENATSTGSSDVFFMKLDDDGLFQSVQTWGGTGSDSPSEVTLDAEGATYITGTYNGTVDFDPGAGTSEATSAGGQDIFLSKFSSDGTYQWTKTWGGTGTDGNSRMMVSAETLLMLGLFSGTVDFDPGAGTNSKTSSGGFDVFMSVLDTSSTYYRTDTFGGSSGDWPDGVIRGLGTSSDTLLFRGFFQSATVDFDPSSETESHASDGLDIYLISFDLIEPAVTVSSTAATVTEGASDEATYTLALRTPPDDDVTVLVSPGPQLYADVASVTFASSTWNVPQTVTLTAADDNSIEDSHTGTVTHTVSSTASEYDGLSVSSVSIPITDNDARGSGGGGGDGDDDNDDPGNVPEITPPQDTPGALFEPIPTPVGPLTQAEREEFVGKVMRRLISVLTHLIGLLRAQLAAAGQG